MKKSKTFSGGTNRNLLFSFIIALCSLLFSYLLFQGAFLKNIETKSQDALARFTPPLPRDSVITVVAIDEATINTLSWPISRDYYITLIQILNEYNARNIVFDIAFVDENKDHPQWDTLFALTTADTSLQSAIIHSFYFSVSENKISTSDNTGTILTTDCFPLSSDQPFPQASSVDKPFPFLLQHTRHLGHFNLTADNDGIFRRLPLFIEYNNRLYPGIALLAACSIVEDGHPLIRRNAVLLQGRERTITIPIDDNGNMPVFYNGSGEVFATLSFLEVLTIYKMAQKTGSRSPLLDSIISGKTVFIGNTAGALGDYGPIPTNNNIPKVYIHASALSTIINRHFFTPLSWWKSVVLLILLLFLVARSCLRYKAPIAALVWCSTIIFYFCAAFFFYVNFYTVPLGIPAATLMVFYISLTVYTHFFKEKQVYLLGTALERYVSPIILEKIHAGEKNLVQEKQEREMTVLFSDIKGFSRMCSTMDPESLHRQLTEYLNAMSDIILDNRGAVDKFMGDGIMAYFDSINNERHAFDAISASLQMHETVHSLNVKWRSEGGPDITVRIGINTGRVYIGDLGTRQFSDYTLFGNEVNIAQRLESNAEPGSTFVSQAVYEKTGNDFDFMNRGIISLKNIVSPMTAYKVMGKRKLFRGI